MILAPAGRLERDAAKRIAAFLLVGGVGFLSGCAHPPPPMMPAYDPQGAVEICAGGECGKAGEKFALDDIAKAMADMFAANGPGTWQFCEANRDDRKCIKNQLTYTVNGPISVPGYVPSGALRAGAKYDGKRGVSFRVNIPTIVFDTPSVCDDARSKLSVRSANNIFWQSNVYMCSWGGGPMNIKAEGQYGIDYIDFDRGVMGGDFAIRVSEGGNGFTQGYAVTRLAIGMDEVQQAWLQPRGRSNLTVTAPQVAAPPQGVPPMATAQMGFSRTPVEVSFKSVPPNPDDIAVIIGNADYGKQSRDIPNVTPAYADAAGIQKYVTESLGVRPGNIINLRDATGSQMIRVFGSATNHRGQLYDWVKSGRSRVFVYYAGHGAPGSNDGNAYLVPSDADAARIDLNGYSLSTLYNNLGMLPAKNVTVVLEACFSGAAPSGSVIAKASPIFIKPKTPPVPDNLTVIAAGQADQMASWQQDGQHSLFTTYYLKGMAGDADVKPYGDGDGTVSLKELDAYLQDTLTYYARRYYGRDQTAKVSIGKNGS